MLLCSRPEWEGVGGEPPDAQEVRARSKTFHQKGQKVVVVVSLAFVCQSKNEDDSSLALRVMAQRNQTKQTKHPTFWLGWLAPCPF